MNTINYVRLFTFEERGRQLRNFEYYKTSYERHARYVTPEQWHALIVETARNIARLNAQIAYLDAREREGWETIPDDFYENINAYIAPYVVE